MAITLHQCPSIAPHGVPLDSTYVKVTNELFILVMFLQTYIFYRKIMQKANVMIILILNGFNRESYEEIKMRQRIHLLYQIRVFFILVVTNDTWLL